MREPTMPDRIELPSGLAWLRTLDGGPEWLEAAPRLVREVADAWRLRLGRPFPDAFESIALPVTLPDRGEAVLKVHFPNRENEHEAEALARWDGSGAVRLLEHDPVRHALLIERCVRIPRVLATRFHGFWPPDSAGKWPTHSTGSGHPSLRSSPAAT